jgi:hypothetical protein
VKTSFDTAEQKRQTRRKTMPGYILVQMEMTPITKSLVKNTPKVTGFLGAQGQDDPPPLRESEVQRITTAMSEGAMKPKPKVHFDDGDTVRVIDFSPHGQDHRLEIEYPSRHHGLVIPKGSICLDGISLTAAEVGKDSITCWIIPHSLEVTHLHTKKSGDRLNVEFDMLGKHVRELVRLSTPS